MGKVLLGCRLRIQCNPPKATEGRRVVQHGHLPEREVMTGIGPVAVRQPLGKRLMIGF